MAYAFTPNDIKRLKECVDQGIVVKTNIEDLRLSLKDLVDSVSEELDLSKKVLNKTIQIAFKESQDKDSFENLTDELSAVEELLAAAGKR